MSKVDQVNWKILQPLLQCPNCQSASLLLADDDVTCTDCNDRYQIVNGIIDFRGQNTLRRPVFYQNRYYKKFMSRIDKIHSAHYLDGSLSSWIETCLKADLFRIVLPSEAPSIDLGCGFGNAFPLLGPEDRIIGVDTELSLLQETRQRYPRASLICADLANLPFKNGSLNRVFSIAVLEHIFYLEQTLEHVQRVLSSEGNFYVTVPTEGSVAVGLASLLTSNRNAKLIGLTPKESRMAQRIDHCNTVFLIHGALRKFFQTDANSLWPFRSSSMQINLAKAYRLSQLRGV